MNRGLLLVAVLSSISFVIQLLPVISVPITGLDHHIYFAKYNNVTFGVFGLCDYVQHRCSKPEIGYPIGTSLIDDELDNSNDELDEDIDSDMNDGPDDQLDNDFGAVELPSDARHSISKLLVVHVVAFALTSLLLIVTYGFIMVIWVKEILQDKQIAQAEKDLPSHLSHMTNNHHDHNHQEHPLPTARIKRNINLIPFLNFQLVVSILSCLFTLLGLLSDILLFSPYLSYLGWLQIIPMICLAVLVTMVCFMRRSIFSRRHLDEEYFYPNDDMKVRRNLGVSNSNDASSDDGFYIYTNGFYSNYGDREQHTQSQQSNSNSWRRHTPFNEDDDVSLNSSKFPGILSRERIQLSDLRGTTNTDSPVPPGPSFSSPA